MNPHNTIILDVQILLHGCNSKIQVRFLKVIRVTDRTVPPQCASTTAHHRLLPQGSYCPSPSFALPHLRAGKHAHAHYLTGAHGRAHTRISIVTSGVCILHGARSPQPVYCVCPPHLVRVVSGTKSFIRRCNVFE